MKNQNMGSVSSGTMRTEDLIPAFLDALENQKPLHKSHRELVKEIKARMQDAEYYSSEDADYDLEDLFVALNEYAPPYFYFGSHPGDGADYGFWFSKDDTRATFEGLKVSDLSEIPRGYTGEVLNVNDHGNVTLYKSVRGRLYEIWAVV